MPSISHGRATTLRIITLSIMTLSIMTLSIMTLSIMTLSIMTLSNYIVMGKTVHYFQPSPVFAIDAVAYLSGAHPLQG